MPGYIMTATQKRKLLQSKLLRAKKDTKNLLKELREKYLKDVIALTGNPLILKGGSVQCPCCSAEFFEDESFYKMFSKVFSPIVPLADYKFRKLSDILKEMGVMSYCDKRKDYYRIKVLAPIAVLNKILLLVKNSKQKLSTGIVEKTKGYNPNFRYSDKYLVINSTVPKSEFLVTYK